jgi:hypothetical protein
MMFFNANVVPQRRLAPATEANIETKAALYRQQVELEAGNKGCRPFMLDYFVAHYKANLQDQALRELENEERHLQMAERRPRG